MAVTPVHMSAGGDRWLQRLRSQCNRLHGQWLQFSCHTRRICSCYQQEKCGDQIDGYPRTPLPQMIAKLRVEGTLIDTRSTTQDPGQRRLSRYGTTARHQEWGACFCMAQNDILEQNIALVQHEILL
jgi:hypothetical protein